MLQCYNDSILQVTTRLSLAISYYNNMVLLSYIATTCYVATWNYIIWCICYSLLHPKSEFADEQGPQLASLEKMSVGTDIWIHWKAKRSHAHHQGLSFLCCAICHVHLWSVWMHGQYWLQTHVCYPFSCIIYSLLMVCLLWYVFFYSFTFSYHVLHCMIHSQSHSALLCNASLIMHVEHSGTTYVRIPWNASLLTHVLQLVYIVSSLECNFSCILLSYPL